jgi:hypothetical protein
MLHRVAKFDGLASCIVPAWVVKDLHRYGWVLFSAKYDGLWTFQRTQWGGNESVAAR